MEATINFKNGETLTVEKNGDCYILAAKPEFPEDLADLEIVSEEGTREYEHAILVECASIDGRYWFAFIEEDPKERELRELRETNDMLTECILEMSEVVYGDE